MSSDSLIFVLHASTIAKFLGTRHRFRENRNDPADEGLGLKARNDGRSRTVGRLAAARRFTELAPLHSIRGGERQTKTGMEF